MPPDFQIHIKKRTQDTKTASSEQAALDAPSSASTRTSGHAWPTSATTSPPASPRPNGRGWLGEAEGLRVSLAAARDKLAQLDERTRRAATVSLGIPA
jgi:hypothetical protein